MVHAITLCCFCYPLSILCFKNLIFQPANSRLAHRLQKAVTRQPAKRPGVRYGSRGHTRAPVPVFAKCFREDMFLEFVQGADTRAASFLDFSGQYIDNTDIFTVMKAAPLNHAKE